MSGKCDGGYQREGVGVPHSHPEHEQLKDPPRVKSRAKPLRVSLSIAKIVQAESGRLTSYMNGLSSGGTVTMARLIAKQMRAELRLAPFKPRFRQWGSRLSGARYGSDHSPQRTRTVPSGFLRQQSHCMRILQLFLLVLSICICPASGHAKTVSIIGTWSGGGVMRFASGSKERVRCRVRYHKSSAKTYGAVATCATTSGKITQTAQIRKRGKGRYSGTFYNSQFNVSGRIRVIMRGRRQTVTLTSRGGSGRLRLRKR